jgi:GNAT superfamily N-acetyltransferase
LNPFGRAQPDAAHVRAAGSEDLDTIAELMGRSPLLNRYHISREDARQALEDAIAGDDLVLVADTASLAPAGLAWANKLRGFGGSAYLRFLLVDERWQGRGIGELLLKQVEAWAVLRSSNLLLITTEDNHDARRFYERHGYQRAGQLQRLILPDADEVIYHKRLSGPPLEA